MYLDQISAIGHYLIQVFYISQVRLAAQTFSRSVADAFDFLREGSEISFSGSEPTTKFIRITSIDELFDRLNSKNPFQKSIKAPLSPHN